MYNFSEKWHVQMFHCTVKHLNMPFNFIYYYRLGMHHVYVTDVRCRTKASLNAPTY